MVQVKKDVIEKPTTQTPRRPTSDRATCEHSTTSYFRMGAEHIELHDELAERARTTSSSSAGLHTKERANPPSQSVDDSLLADGPPRLASTLMSTLTTMPTQINGIYMLSLPYQQLHRREAPTIFEDNNKSDTTAGSSTTFKNWASELKL
eukprot:5991265-Amphidinium_carterae.1